MAVDVNGSTDYLEYTSSAPVTAVPITLAAWVKPTSVAALGSPTWILRVGNHASYDQGFALQQAEGSGFFRYRIHSGASVSEPDTTGWTAGAWQHIAGVSSSSTSHTCYRNGVAGSTLTTAVTPTGVNYVSVGRLDALGGVDYFSGSIAECAVWNVALSATEIAALAAGADPRRVSATFPVFYVSLRDSGDFSDLSGGGRTLTNNGSTWLGWHPIGTIQYPRRAYY